MREYPLPLAINRSRKAVFFDDGETRPFVSMIDELGEFTDDPDEALYVVVRIHDDSWLNIDLRSFGDIARH